MKFIQHEMVNLGQKLGTQVFVNQTKREKSFQGGVNRGELAAKLSRAMQSDPNHINSPQGEKNRRNRGRGIHFFFGGTQTEKKR